MHGYDCTEVNGMAACISNSTRRNAPTTRKAGSGAAQNCFDAREPFGFDRGCGRLAGSLPRLSFGTLYFLSGPPFPASLTESNRRVHLTSLGVTLMAIKCFSESVSTHPNASTISETSNSCACVSHRRTVTVSTPVLWVGLRLTRVEVPKSTVGSVLAGDSVHMWLTSASPGSGRSVSLPAANRHYRGDR